MIDGIRFSHIVATDLNWVIGKGNSIPWHEPEDLKYFKQLTQNKVVIMGYNTFDSILVAIGRPLPNRLSIVVTNKDITTLEPFINVIYVNTITNALHLAVVKTKALTARFTKEEAEQNAEVFIAGGAQLYRQTIKFVDRVYRTAVEVTVSVEPLKEPDQPLVFYPAKPLKHANHSMLKTVEGVNGLLVFECFSFE